MKNILSYSSPSTAKKRLQHFYGKKTELYRSSRKDKKYMIEHEGKWIHFGQMGFEDFTKHEDLQRRERFRKRNHHWKYAEKYTPAHLSWYVLW